MPDSRLNGVMEKHLDSLPDIFTFIDYRAWLGEVFDTMRQSDPSLTHRTFSTMCGYRSSGAIALILSGKRRLTEKAARRLARTLKLDAEQAHHLNLMVAYEQAEGFDARARLMRKMKSAARFAEAWSDSLDAYEFYGEWYLPVLREMISLPDFEENPRWIAARLHQRLAPRLITQGMEQLLNLGFVERDENGKLRPKERIISTPSEVTSDVLKQHQRDMMAKASDALDTQPRHMRDMRVATVAISRHQADRIKGLMVQLQKDVLDVVSEEEPIEVVYQYNTQWFALTNPPQGESQDQTPPNEDPEGAS